MFINIKLLTKEQTHPIKSYLDCGKSKHFIAQALNTNKKGIYADELAKVVIDILLPYKDFVFSITSENGKERAKYKK